MTCPECGRDMWQRTPDEWVCKLGHLQPVIRALDEPAAAPEARSVPALAFAAAPGVLALLIELVRLVVG